MTDDDTIILTEAEFETALARVRDAAFAKGQRTGRDEQRADTARLARAFSALNGDGVKFAKAVEALTDTTPFAERHRPLPLPTEDDHRQTSVEDLPVTESLQKAVAHAPVGGVSIGGKHFAGGMFIPAEVMAEATEEEKVKVHGGAGSKEAGASGSDATGDKARKVPTVDHVKKWRKKAASLEAECEKAWALAEAAKTPEETKIHADFASSLAAESERFSDLADRAEAFIVASEKSSAKKEKKAEREASIATIRTKREEAKQVKEQAKENRKKAVSEETAALNKLAARGSDLTDDFGHFDSDEVYAIFDLLQDVSNDYVEEPALRSWMPNERRPKELAERREEFKDLHDKLKKAIANYQFADLSGNEEAKADHGKTMLALRRSLALTLSGLKQLDKIRDIIKAPLKVSKAYCWGEFLKAWNSAVPMRNPEPTDPLPDADDDADTDPDDTDLHTPHDDPEVSVALLTALVDAVSDAVENGDDPEVAAERFRDLIDNADEADEVAEGDTVEKGVWNKDLHPKGIDGRFISRERINEAKTNPEVAKELRAEVKPADAKKLDDAIEGKTDTGRTKRGLAKEGAANKRAAKSATKARADELIRKLSAGKLLPLSQPITAADLHALADHLPLMTVADLRRARAALHASFKGDTRKEQMVERLKQHALSERAGLLNAPTEDASVDSRDALLADSAVAEPDQGRVGVAESHAEQMRQWEADRPGSVVAQEARDRAESRLSDAHAAVQPEPVSTPAGSVGSRAEYEAGMVKPEAKELPAMKPEIGSDVSARTISGETHIGKLEDIDNGTAIIRKPDGSAHATGVEAVTPAPKPLTPKQQKEKEKLHRMAAEAAERNEKFEAQDRDALNMSRAAFVEKHGNPRESKQYGLSHRRLVEAAIKRGEPVSDAAMLDYPDLHRAVEDTKAASTPLREHLTAKHTPDAVEAVLNSPLTSRGERLNTATGSNLEGFAAQNAKKHHDAVARQLAAGKPVPDAVLWDYPDLAAKYAPPPTPTATDASATPAVADTTPMQTAPTPLAGKPRVPKPRTRASGAADAAPTEDEFAAASKPAKPVVSG